MKKNNHLFLIFFIIIFLFLGTDGVFALEVSLPGLGSDPGLADYVSYIFNSLVALAGILALISFTIGAIGLINPNIESHNDAKERMRGAVLGLVLTLSSFVIMNTINPNFIKPNLEPLPETFGVFYTKGTEKLPAPKRESNVANRSQELKGFNYLKYICLDTGEYPAVLLWRFTKKGLEDGNGTSTGVTVTRMACGEAAVSINNAGSFRWTFESPGIYYCLGGCSGTMCSGYMSAVHTSNQEKIAAPFNENIRGIRIVNDTSEDLYYGAIFHKVAGLKNGSTCTLPIGTSGSTQEQACHFVNDIDPASVNIFSLNKKPTTSGDGVSFYSEPFGQLTGMNAGFLDVPASDITFAEYKKDASAIKFLYTNVSETDAYQKLCPNFQKCSGSVRIKGSYLVGLYSANQFCQTFTKDVPNLKAQEMIASGGNKLEKVYIIPIK